MKWYDYLVCFVCADMISAGVFHNSLVYVTIGMCCYYLWEDFRKGEVKNG